MRLSLSGCSREVSHRRCFPTSFFFLLVYFFSPLVTTSSAHSLRFGLPLQFYLLLQLSFGCFDYFFRSLYFFNSLSDVWTTSPVLSTSSTRSRMSGLLLLFSLISRRPPLQFSLISGPLLLQFSLIPGPLPPQL